MTVTTEAEIYARANPTVRIAEVARLYGLDRSTLSRHLAGKTTSREVYRQQCERKLSPPQEKRLVKHINVLTDRGWAPSYPMVRRFAAEISKKSVGKNWPGKFVKRNEKHLASGFLQAIEIARKKADSAKSYQRWFDQVFEPLPPCCCCIKLMCAVERLHRSLSCLAQEYIQS